jgi:hypothetical protein
MFPVCRVTPSGAVAPCTGGDERDMTAQILSRSSDVVRVCCIFEVDTELKGDR